MFLDKKLQIFLCVAESGSFSRAARKLSLSQSVISFHMDTLERELGTSLFRREGRTISLTPEGEFLFEKGKRIAREAKNLENALESERIKAARTINLAGDALTCAFTFPWTLAAFREKHPDVRFIYQHLDMETLMEKLIDGELDVGLCGHRVKNRKLAAQECYHDDIILVSAPERTPDTVTFDELRGLPLLWITNDRGMEYVVERGLAEGGMATGNLNIFMEVEDLPLTKMFLRAGIGAAFLPSLTVEDELRFGMLKEVKIGDLRLERTTYLVHRRAGRQREIVTRFIDFVRELHRGEENARKDMETTPGGGSGAYERREDSGRGNE